MIPLEALPVRLSRLRAFQTPACMAQHAARDPRAPKPPLMIRLPERWPSLPSTSDIIVGPSHLSMAIGTLPQQR